MRKKSNFIVQGGILAAAGILSRIIGIARRFPMEHIIGDVGNGYYSAAYEVYAMMLIISCYSLPLQFPRWFLPRLERDNTEMQTGLSSVLWLLQWQQAD